MCLCAEIQEFLLILSECICITFGRFQCALVLLRQSGWSTGGVTQSKEQEIRF